MERVVLCDARGPLNHLIDSLSGEDGRLRLGQLKRMLRMNPKRPPFSPTWRRFMVGGSGEHPDFSDEEIRLGTSCDWFIYCLRDRMTSSVSLSSREVSFSSCLVGDLGISDSVLEGPPEETLFSVVGELGKLCCDEDVLWIASQRQNKSDCPLIILSNPVYDRDKIAHFLCVDIDGGGTQWTSVFSLKTTWSRSKGRALNLPRGMRLIFRRKETWD